MESLPFRKNIVLYGVQDYIGEKKGGKKRRGKRGEKKERKKERKKKRSPAF